MVEGCHKFLTSMVREQCHFGSLLLDALGNEQLFLKRCGKLKTKTLTDRFCVTENYFRDISCSIWYVGEMYVVSSSYSKQCSVRDVL
jgi:hypothetical protein